MLNFRQFIHESVEIDTRSYMRGRCAIFAMALHLEKGYPLGVLWDLNEDGDRDYMAMGEVDHDAYKKWSKDNDGEDWWPDSLAAVIHVFCYKTSTVLVDVKGRTTEAAMSKETAARSGLRGMDTDDGPAELHYAKASQEEVEALMKTQSPANETGGMLAAKPGEIEKLRQHIRENPDMY